MIRRWTRPFLAIVAVILLLTVIDGLFTTAGTLASRPGAAFPKLDEACSTENPYLVSPCYRGILKAARDTQFSPSAPSLILFNDTPNDIPEYPLATYKDIGTVWGLGYRRQDRALYAAAYMKRQLPFGPNGPGAIYRIDMTNGSLKYFLTVPNAGPDPHARNLGQPDKKSEDYVSKSSLGDLDFSEDGAIMFVTNLVDGKIYRYAMPDGKFLDAIDNGAAKESWSNQARPFALAVHKGLLYHGVVNSGEKTRNRNDLAAYVYESDLDGGNMRQVANVPLLYSRGSVRLGADSRKMSVAWQVWKDEVPQPRPNFSYGLYPQPLLTDIEFDNDGAMVLGLRDRTTDITAQFLIYDPKTPTQEHLGIGVGDTLYGTYNGNTWDFAPSPEHYKDDVPYMGDESTTGGLANIWWTNVVVSSAIGLQEPGIESAPAEGFLWFGNTSGDKMRLEQACAELYLRPLGGAQAGLQLVKSALAGNGEIPPPPPPFVTPPPPPTPPGGGPMPTPETPPAPEPQHGPGSTGDVELICPLKDVPPTEPAAPVVTDTPVPPTDTPLPPTNTPVPPPTDTAVPPTDTPVPPTPTPTPTPKPRPIYLPILIKDKLCQDGFKYTDVVLVIDTSLTMLDVDDSGHMKITSAKTASHSFVKLLQLPNDQVGVVQFNRDAKLVQPLTGNRALADAAIDALQSHQYTRIDLGIELAQQELTSVRHNADHNQTMVLLTDGIPDGTTHDVVVATAAAAKAAGIRIFTIGLGKDGELDLPLLQDSASSLSDFYRAPTGDELDGIYRQLAYIISFCRPEMYWPFLPNPGTGAYSGAAR